MQITIQVKRETDKLYTMLQNACTANPNAEIDHLECTWEYLAALFGSRYNMPGNPVSQGEKTFNPFQNCHDQDAWDPATKEFFSRISDIRDRHRKSSTFLPQGGTNKSGSSLTVQACRPGPSNIAEEPSRLLAAFLLSFR